MWFKNVKTKKLQITYFSVIIFLFFLSHAILSDGGSYKIITPPPGKKFIRPCLIDTWSILTCPLLKERRAEVSRATLAKIQPEPRPRRRWHLRGAQRCSLQCIGAGRGCLRCLPLLLFLPGLRPLARLGLQAAHTAHQPANRGHDRRVGQRDPRDGGHCWPGYPGHRQSGASFTVQEPFCPIHRKLIFLFDVCPWCKQATDVIYWRSLSRDLLRQYL